MISKKVINKVKDNLLEQKQEMLEHVSINQDKFTKADIGDLSSYDNHPGEQGTELFEKEKEQAMNAHAKQKISEINLALQAIENETYGKCEVCGKEIDEERLLAVPTTFRCIKHANNDSHERRPVEEKVINPDIVERDTKSEALESSVYNGKDAWQEVEAHGTSETPSDFFDEHESYNSMLIDKDENTGSSEHLDNVAKTGIKGKSKVNRDSDIDRYEK